MMNTSPLMRTQIQYLSRCAIRAPNLPCFNPSTLAKPTTSFHPRRRNILAFSTRKSVKLQEAKLEPECTVLEVRKIGDGSTSSTAAAASSRRSMVLLGATASILLVMGMMVDEQKALALGPGGPIMEEFWDNVRRYCLYALTVSTGALYTIFVPIFELLKNPISAILIIVIFGGSFFILSQVLSAMVGVTEFSYDYSY